MFTGVPTKPANEWHGARLDTIQRLTCKIQALSGQAAVRELNRCGLLIESDRPLKVGSRHWARFGLGAFQIELALRVTHASSHYEGGAAVQHRAGLAFQLRRDADYLALDGFLDRLNSPTALDAAA
jgi:hypothetical protein